MAVPVAPPQGTQQIKRTAPSPVFATSVAATVESFYRSALNAFINRALLGQQLQRLFPDMHIQAPTRIVYINGIKQSRAWLANNVDPEDYKYPSVMRGVQWVAPGLVTTPVSSVLEAANAGAVNPEPLLARRWLRGIVARSMREMIFAVGVNQLAESIEDSIPHEKVSNGLLRNNLGSLAAGVVAGYFSHVPHNMSALKLHYPHSSYADLFRNYAKESEGRLPVAMPVEMKRRLAKFYCVLCPKALLPRTTQIVGTFVLLNGIIYLLKDVNPIRSVGWGETEAVPLTRSS